MFYEFNQNNSGGIFHFDEKEGITHYVIIEADTHSEANSIANHIGIYFNGCETGGDCSCCGDRWYPVHASDASEVPTHYGTPIDEIEDLDYIFQWMEDGKEFAIHYKDGTIEWRGPNGRKK